MAKEYIVSTSRLKTILEDQKNHRKNYWSHVKDQINTNIIHESQPKFESLFIFYDKDTGELYEITAFYTDHIIKSTDQGNVIAEMIIIERNPPQVYDAL